MKCPECGGVGRIHYGEEWCSACNGTGEVQTNEYWFCSLSTEEKAKWLEEKMTWAAKEQGTFTAKGWEKWLKQPHTKVPKKQEKRK